MSAPIDDLPELPESTSPSRPSDETDQVLFERLNSAFAECNSPEAAEILGKLCRRYGMSRIARKTTLCRPQIYTTFSKKGNPTLRSLVAVCHAMGLTVRFSKEK